MKMKNNILLLAAVLTVLAISASLAFSQTPKPATNPAVITYAPLPQAEPPQQVKSTVGAALPQPTDLQTTRLENISLKLTLLNQEANQLIGQRGELIDQIQKEHPGFIWDTRNNRLIPATPKSAGKQPAKPTDPTKK